MSMVIQSSRSRRRRVLSNFTKRTLQKKLLTIMTILIVKIITMDIKSSGNQTENHPRRPRSRFQVRGSSAPT